MQKLINQDSNQINNQITKQSMKSSKIWLYLCLLTLAVIFIITTNKYNIKQTIQSQYTQYFAKEIVGENTIDNATADYEFEQQIVDLKEQLDAYEAEIYSLKHQYKATALTMVNHYRALINELLTLNYSLYAKQDYSNNIKNIRLNIKNYNYGHNYANTDIEHCLNSLEQYNEQYIKHQVMNAKIEFTWFSGLINRWLVIEKVEITAKDYSQHKTQAKQALNDLNNYFSSEKFLQVYIGI